MARTTARSTTRQRGAAGAQAGKFATRTVGALAGAGVAVLAYAAASTRHFRVVTVDVPVLPPDAPELRVLHISDLHMAPWQHTKIAFVRSLARLKPDLVVSTGDNFGHRDALPALEKAYEPLTAFPGIFVLASNDHLGPRPMNPLNYLARPSRPGRGFWPGRRDTLPGPELGQFLTDQGWHSVENARLSLDVPTGADSGSAGGSVTVQVSGTGDAHVDDDRLPPRDATAESEAAARRPAVHLGVTHAPYARTLQALRDDGAELILAGHTHGGQVCVPGYGALTTNCDLDPARASGLSGWPGPRPDEPGGTDSVWLHVSAGLGTSIFAPVRVACRPTATILRLVPRARP